MIDRHLRAMSYRKCPACKVPAVVVSIPGPHTGSWECPRCSKRYEFLFGAADMGIAKVFAALSVDDPQAGI